VNDSAQGDDKGRAEVWVKRFLDDLGVLRSFNTVRAYAFDLARWTRFCFELEIDPFRAHPRTAIEFIRVERERSYRTDKTISARTELVNRGETNRRNDYCSGVASMGGLIQTGPGKAGGSGS
jgi:hypothetical protein